MKTLYNAPRIQSPLKQLADSPQRFKKQLIRFGDWIDPLWPEEVMRIDRVVLETMVRNFKNGIPGRIPVPLTHTDNPEYNTGELVDLYIEGDGANLEDGLYGVLEIRRADTAEQIKSETIWDVSISFADNYQDNETGALYGHTLIHVALVNNPYIKKMGSFTALAEDLKKIFGSKVAVRMLSESHKENTMTKVKLTNDREFAVTVTYKEGEEDVTVTLEAGQEIEVAEDQADAVQTIIAEATAPAAEEPAPEEGEEEVVTPPAAGEGDTPAAPAPSEDTNLSETARELAETNRKLAEANQKLRAQDIEKIWQTNLSEGKLVPAQKEAFIALADALHGQTRTLSDGATQNLSELLAEFVSKTPRIVSLNQENGKIEDETKEQLKDVKEGLQATGVTEERFLAMGGGQPVSAAELKNLGKDQ